ncbi:MAG TPA: ABC transporter permease, partial [Spirochaetota bacterium]|nr:ABC transporter permease [Spirochaetota bacterium]
MIIIKKLKDVLVTVIGGIGKNTINIVYMLGYSTLIFLEVAYHSKAAFEKRREILKQMYYAGVKTFIVVSIVALFTGMILALQIGLELKPYQQQSLVGNIIIATLTREMAPFVTAIILIAAVGSTMAAEVGTM